MLFVLGGDGTHAGANAIHEEVLYLFYFCKCNLLPRLKAYYLLTPFIHASQCRKRKLKVSVVGVPKTIDNDIMLIDKTFGFDTAVEAAQKAINSAYIEVINKKKKT